MPVSDVHTIGVDIALGGSESLGEPTGIAVSTREQLAQRSAGLVVVAQGVGCHLRLTDEVAHG